jgi:hypothetical protein
MLGLAGGLQETNGPLSDLLSGVEMTVSFLLEEVAEEIRPETSRILKASSKYFPR